MKHPNEPATFRLAAQCLNQQRHRVPQKTEQDKKSTLVDYEDNDDKEEQKKTKKKKKKKKTKKKKKKKKKKPKKKRDTKRNFPLRNFSNPLLMILHLCRSKPHSTVQAHVQKETRIPEQRVVLINPW